MKIFIPISILVIFASCKSTKETATEVTNTTKTTENNGGFSIKIASITEHENNVMVIVEENIPDNNCITTSVITYPYEIIEMPTTIKKVVFKNVEKIYSCEE